MPVSYDKNSLRDGLYITKAVFGKYNPPDYPRLSKPCWPASKLYPHE